MVWDALWNRWFSCHGDQGTTSLGGLGIRWGAQTGRWFTLAIAQPESTWMLNRVCSRQSLRGTDQKPLKMKGQNICSVLPKGSCGFPVDTLPGCMTLVAQSLAGLKRLDRAEEFMHLPEWGAWALPTLGDWGRWILSLIGNPLGSAVCNHRWTRRESAPPFEMRQGSNTGMLSLSSTRRRWSLTCKRSPSASFWKQRC